LLRERGVRKVGATRVPRTMCSTVAACLATSFKIKGVSFSVTSACATSAHCIGVAAEQIRWGNQDVMFCGGGEEEHWSLTCLFDAMGALSSARNDAAQTASRAYDAQRDGFVIAGGGGMIVLESLEHAQARNARIYAELAGYGVSADGQDMVQPSGEGAARCMRQALDGLQGGSIDYLNTHGTSTPVGDVIELKAVREVFGESVPPISSTKSLTGHALGAAGVQEAIYCLLMMRDGFVAGSANIDTLDAACADFPILRATERRRIDTAMSNSFGFGGTNATLVFRRY
jgi:3-oxoacyl-[acyl-carrier-protein] synthase-1